MLVAVAALSLALWRVNQGRIRALQQVEELQAVAQHELVVRIEYGSLFLLRIGDSRFAVRMTSDAAGTVAYTWLSISDLPSGLRDLEWQDAFEHAPGAVKGNGELSEADGVTSMNVGPLSVEWSMSDASSGWLYFFADTMHSDTDLTDLSVLRHQVGRLNQVEEVDDRLWKRVGDYSSRQAERK